MAAQDVRVGRKPSAEYLRCDECNTPVAEVRGDTLVIRSRHNREEHVTILRIADLVDLLRKAA